MKIIVPVKRVIDYNARITIKADNSGVETSNVKMSMNPFDEIALEEAVRLREKGLATQVSAVAIGIVQAQETLRTAMAMGADHAIYIPSEIDGEPIHEAQCLQALILRDGYDLAIVGKQAIDDDANQTGQMLAGLLGWPQATFASKVEVSGNTLMVTREVDGGSEIMQFDIPAVITADLRLNTPRYASLPNIMKAKKKPIETIDPSSLGVDFTPRVRVLRVDAPPKRSGGITVATVDELIDKLAQGNLL